MYKYDHLRSLVRLFFFIELLCDTHQPTANYKGSRICRSNSVEAYLNLKTGVQHALLLACSTVARSDLSLTRYLKKIQ